MYVMGGDVGRRGGSRPPSPLVGVSAVTAGPLCVGTVLMTNTRWYKYGLSPEPKSTYLLEACAPVMRPPGSPYGWCVAPKASRVMVDGRRYLVFAWGLGRQSCGISNAKGISPPPATAPLRLPLPASSRKSTLPEQFQALSAWLKKVQPPPAKGCSGWQYRWQ